MNDTSPGLPGKGAWASGNAYERYVGRWSRLVAPEFLRWLHVPRERNWLDVGCGTGALSAAILQGCEPRKVRGIDPSAAFVEQAREQVRDEHASFEVGDARELNEGTGAYDAVVSGLMLNFVPEPERALGEMARVTVPGGIVAAYVWDYAGKMDMMQHFWDAAAFLDPAMGDLNEALRFQFCSPAPLTELFRDTGLAEIAVMGIEIETRFEDFDDYWSPFLGGEGSAPRYIKTLPEERRTALRERVRAGLPIAADGSIALAARAWAVRGHKTI